MWFMNNIQGMTEVQAYDKARREFYALRQEEEVERRVAKEEAQMVGAYFGKGFLQVGLEIEDRTYEQWKKWAGKQIQNIAAEQTSVYTNFANPEAAEAAEAKETAEAELEGEGEEGEPENTGKPA